MGCGHVERSNQPDRREMGTVSDHNKCPTCRSGIEAIIPIVETGHTVVASGMYIKDGDRVIGWTLKPCGHVIDRWEAMP
jgi:hypothetical protein